jgi:hypothetical protein
MWLGEQITERGIGNGVSLDHHDRHPGPFAASGQVDALIRHDPDDGGSDAATSRRPRHCF